jgi:hypothetical protein
VRRLFLRTAALITLLGLALSLSVTVGRSQFSSKPVQQFHMNDCEAPCLLGVTVGKTRYTEGKDILARFTAPAGYTAALTEERNDTISVKKIAITLTNPTNQEDTLTFGTWFKEGVADYVEMRRDTFYPAGLPTFADVIGTYGPPTCAYQDIALNGRYWDVFIVDPDHLMVIRVQGGQQITWDAPVAYLSIRQSHASTEMGNPCACAQWKGINAQYAAEGSDDTCSGTQAGR